MITYFFAGFLFALAIVLIAAHFGIIYAAKAGFFSCAIWDEKEKTWRVYGCYLSNAGKILNSLRGLNTDKVKYMQ